MKNLLTDIAGVKVGHAEDRALASGVTAIVFDEPTVASVDIRGGGPASRDVTLLEPGNTVETINGVTLSGGSAFGLEAAGGAMAWLAEQGRGFSIGSAVVPIVPGASVFDLVNGGNKAWGRFAPYRELGYAAAAAASSDFALGSAGAGLGATTANLKGGLGSASAVTASGIKVGAIAVVNAVGSAVVGNGPWFWAAPFETNGELGGRGQPGTYTPGMLDIRMKGGAQPNAGENTTIAMVVTDARLTKADVKRLAIIANTGFAMALRPVHAPLDGDLVFAAATGAKPVDGPAALTEIGTLAASTLARAIARGVYEAAALPFAGALPAWKDRFLEKRR